MGSILVTTPVNLMSSLHSWKSTWYRVGLQEGCLLGTCAMGVIYLCAL